MAPQFRTPQPVVWINGLPAVGKQTVAQCLAQMFGCDRAVLIDDREFTDQLDLPQDTHLDRCASLNYRRTRALSLGGEVSSGNGRNTRGATSTRSNSNSASGPDSQFTRQLQEKQEACFRKYLEDPAALNRIVIFTDCLANDAAGAQGAQRYADAARRANRPFVPVYIECQPEEHERRSQGSDRQYSQANGEIISSADAIHELQSRNDGRLFAFPLKEWPGLYVNVTEQGTHETAMEILSFVNAVCEKRSQAVAATAAAAVLRRPGSAY